MAAAPDVLSSPVIQRLKERETELRQSGYDAAEVARLAPHQAYPGDRPSTVVMLDRLEPATLGALFALYEHKVFVESVIWRINPFDQWGVEWGKRLATDIDAALAGTAAPTVDAATARWIARLSAVDKG